MGKETHAPHVHTLYEYATCTYRPMSCGKVGKHLRNICDPHTHTRAYAQTVRLQIMYIRLCLFNKTKTKKKRRQRRRHTVTTLRPDN